MKRTMRLLLCALIAPAILAACTTSYDCEGAKAYMYAQQFPPLKSPPGLDVPPPNNSMTVPDVADGPVRRYKKPPRSTQDNPFAYCLVSPPLMPPANG